MMISANTTRFLDEVINKNEYSFLFKELNVMDVGCNIGAFSLWIYHLAKKIWAIDLSSENIENLKKTIKENNLIKIIPYHLAIAEKTGLTTIAEFGEAGMGAWRMGQGNQAIPCFSIADFMKLHEIEYVDVLKLDVEGEEQKILEAPDFPKDKISTIIGELHGAPHQPRTEAKDVVEKMGYRYFEFPWHHFMARKI